MATKENENGVKGFEFRTRTNKSKWQTLKTGIYNPSTKEILGRTGKNWGQLLIFYTIFYVILAALFAICMQGLLATLDDKMPKWTLERSLIGTNPGLGFRPISNRTEEGSLIWYSPKNRTTVDKWIKLTDEFLAPYTADQNGKNFESCDFSKAPNENKVCAVDISEFRECSRNNSYGYTTNSPCIFLKLNKIFGWVPEYYKNGTKEMEQYDGDLANLVENAPGDYVWITCQGEKPVDKENIQQFQYYPNQGFPAYYFPYTNTKNYLSPLVAVRVINPMHNIIISIECRAWAKNIVFKGGHQQREGSVYFEILVD